MVEKGREKKRKKKGKEGILAWGGGYGYPIIHTNIQLFRDILDMDPSITEEEEFVNWVAGNMVLEKSTPMAHRSSS